MATLNTLRTKGGVLLITVIAIALVAFLLGDLSSLGSGFDSKRMRIGTINGTHINYQEFLVEAENNAEVLQNLYNLPSLSQEQVNYVREDLWRNLIIKNAYAPGFEKLGLTVGDDESVDMCTGQYISPVISQLFANPQTGVYDPAVIRNFVASLEHYPAYQSVWNYLTEQMSVERAMAKYIALVEAGVNVNSLEVAAAMNQNGATYDVEYVFKPYSAIADSLVTVTEKEVKNYYKEHESMFKQKAARDIEYVVFDMLPSPEDYSEAGEYVETLAAEFAAAEDPIQYAKFNTQETNVSYEYVNEQNIPEEFYSLAFGKEQTPMYGPVLENDVYTIARLADTKMAPDSLGAKHILLTAAQKSSADSIVKALKGGASFEALASQYSMDPTVDLGHFAPEQMVTEFSTACENAKVGEIFTVDTQYGTHIVNLTFKTKPVKKALIATVVYNVEPSETTQQAIYTDARNFLNKAGKSYNEFSNAVAELGLLRRMATISSTDRGVNGLENSSEISRWAFNGEKDDVSAIMEVEGDYIIAVVKEVREEGVAPIETVSERIAGLLRNEKKAEMIEAEFAGKATLAEMKAVAGAKEGVAEAVSFSSVFVPGVGVEPALVGAIASSAPMIVSKPVVATGGVYVYQVTNKELKELNEVDEQVRLESLASSFISERLSQALDEECEITDNRVKFF